MDALLVTGAKAPYYQTVRAPFTLSCGGGAHGAEHFQVYNTHRLMPKKKSTLLVVDGVSDVMAEGIGTYTLACASLSHYPPLPAIAPDNLARSLILLCKGCGVLSGVSIPGMER